MEKAISCPLLGDEDLQNVGMVILQIHGTSQMKRNFKKWLLWAAIILLSIALIFMGYTFLWFPGKVITDGRHDLKTNGIWLQHGWLGDDGWFARTGRDKNLFRDMEKIRKLKALLQSHYITDVYPHLCPSTSTGMIPGVDPKQTERFLKEMKGFRVMPWVGGVLGKQVFLQSPQWRKNFISSIVSLLKTYPDFSGIHVNIEPLPSGNQDFLKLLNELRGSLPKGIALSVAAFPPPTIWQPFSEVHWKRDYFEQVARKADQMVVMMYDTAIPLEKVYQYLMSSWTRDILTWAGRTEVLLGIPAYEDAGVGYHNPKVENLRNALMGINAGLSSFHGPPKNLRGIAIYSEWEMDENKWEYLRGYYLKLLGKGGNSFFGLRVQ
jgi:hypothetical protein